LINTLAVDDPIFALASPMGESAIAVIRISGKEALVLLSCLFFGKQPLSGYASHTIHYGMLRNPQNGESIDEIMLAVYKAPAGYTGENGAEIFCHGSLAVINAIITLLLKNGFRQAAPGEFTQRAYLNGKLDLTRAEAVNEIIRSKSDKARALALNRLSGAVEKRINQIKDKLLGLLASFEILIDYPDDDITIEKSAWLEELTVIEEGLNRLLATYATGRIIQEGITVCIAGKTNAGKSTLFNLLLKEDRAIVSEIHGTTRDYLEGAIVIQGIPVRLFDTAGLRVTDNPLELEGIRRTDKILENADCILLVVDAGTGLTADEQAFMEKFGKQTPLIPIWNKVDLNRVPCPPQYTPFSSHTGEGLAILNQRIVESVLTASSLENGEPVIDSLRQKQLLEECSAALITFRTGLDEDSPLDLLAVDLKEALDCLGEITGAITSEDIYKEMFSRFCVGK